MANKYKISPKSLYSFINEGTYKLPRFQRKDTWKEKQYFELCLSVFQDYPIGSVIVNNDGMNLWLLDGRQRRNCIKTLCKDPVTFYGWASKACSFKSNDSDDVIYDKFYTKVEEFLGQDLEEKKASPSAQGESEEAESKAEDEADSSIDHFDSEKNSISSDSLNLLYKYILLVHHKLTTAFNFKAFFDAIDLTRVHCTKNDKNEIVVDPVELSEFIRGINKEARRGEILSSKENFLEYLLERKFRYISDSGRKSPESVAAIHFDKYWDSVIRPAFDIYMAMDAVLTNAEVGFIELNDAKIVDAQNVFSKINSGGTQLNAAELLSAKPYWNKPASPDSRQQKMIDCLYSKLNTDSYIEGSRQYCRWDIAATLLPAVDERKIFFSSQNADPDVSEVNLTEISMGFKLLSSCFAVPRGMSKMSLDNLEKDSHLDWGDSLQEFIRSMKGMIDTIYNNTNLTILPDYGCSLYDILGAAGTMELLAGAWIVWHENGAEDKPHNSADFKKFINGFKNHLDRIFLDRVLGQYKGSGDSKMAANLKDIEKRTVQISTEENVKWKAMIDEVLDGTLNGKTFKHDAMKPLLYYEKIINAMQIIPSDSFDIDHIYPQAMFEAGNGLLNPLDENSLANLALLPSNVNKQKQNKPLNSTSFNNSVRHDIALYEGIDSNDFDKYSKAENFQELKERRSAFFRRAFDAERISYLNS